MTTADVKIEITEGRDEFEKPISFIKSSNHTKSYRVIKTNLGSIMYKVEIVGGGLVPKELSGKYTSQKIAVSAVEDYLSKSKPTPTMKRDNNTKAREERKKIELPSGSQ